MDQQTKALELRVKAQALLEQAQALDGFKPFAIVHDHQYGVSCYLAWHLQEPTQSQAESILHCEFEPDRSESLHVLSDLTIAELCGVSLPSRIEDQAHCSPPQSEPNQAPPG